MQTAACAADPILQGIQTFDNSKKIVKAIFLYQEKNFDFVERKYGNALLLNNPRTYLGDTGFPAFGDLMVATAGQSFTTLGLSIAHSGYAPEGRLQDYQKDLAEQMGSQMNDCVYIVLSPSAADTSGNSYGFASVAVKMSVQVADAVTGKPIWAGQLNTTTRVGKGFIAERLVAAQIYDEAYAVAIFKLLVSAWRTSGIL